MQGQADEVLPDEYREPEQQRRGRLRRSARIAARSVPRCMLAVSQPMARSSRCSSVCRVTGSSGETRTEKSRPFSAVSGLNVAST